MLQDNLKNIMVQSLKYNGVSLCSLFNIKKSYTKNYLLIPNTRTHDQPLVCWEDGETCSFNFITLANSDKVTDFHTYWHFKTMGNTTRRPSTVVYLLRKINTHQHFVISIAIHQSNIAIRHWFTDLLNNEKHTRGKHDIRQQNFQNKHTHTTHKNTPNTIFLFPFHNTLRGRKAERIQGRKLKHCKEAKLIKGGKLNQSKEAKEIHERKLN